MILLYMQTSVETDGIENQPLKSRTSSTLLPNRRWRQDKSADRPIRKIEDLRELFLDEVFNYCFRRLGNIDDAEDATADTLHAAFRGFPPHKNLDRFLASHSEGEFGIIGFARKKCNYSQIV